jgi:NodT family efflux transporter outer membrane factor (OMF) lipoprotein
LSFFNTCKKKLAEKKLKKPNLPRVVWQNKIYQSKKEVMIQKKNSTQYKTREAVLKWCYLLLTGLHYYYQQLLRRSIHLLSPHSAIASQFTQTPSLAKWKSCTLVRLVRYLASWRKYCQLSIVNWQLKTVFPVLLVILISSCKVGKEYQGPELELPKQFNGVSFADTSSIADIEWKKFFTNPDLQNLIDKGIKYNHDLLLAIKRIDIAQARVRQAKVLQLPQLDFQIAAQVSRPSDNSLNGISIKSFLGKSYVENYSAALNISWEADIWGKLRSQKEATLAEYLQTYEATKAVQTQLVANIAQGYYNLLMLDKQLEITHSNLVLSDSFVVATRLLKNAGIVNALAVQQAESQRQFTSLLIPQLEENIALQENALQVLTGQLPGAVARNASLSEFIDAGNLSTGLPASVVSRRPDVRSNEMALIAANAQVGVAQANMYPALNISVGSGLESFKASNWFNIPNSLFGLAAGTIAEPIFRRRELKTQFEIAKLQREQAVIQFRQSVLQAVSEVSNALVQADKLKQQEQIAVAQVDTLHHAIFNARLLFKSDLANYLEVITAQENALQAELNLASIQRQQLSAIIELYRSLGGGWK